VTAMGGRKTGRGVPRWRWVLVVALALAETARTQVMEVPLEQQIPLLLKTLSFDRGLRSRVGGHLVLGIVYQQRVRSSLQVKDRVVEIFGETASRWIDSVTVQCVSIDLNDPDDVAAAVRMRHVNLLYVAPLRASDMDAFVASTRSMRVLTLTGVPEYVEDGLAVGIGSRGEKPCILINLASARLAGADFDSHLLNLARVIE